ncbi:MAG: aminoacyl-tRNA hydrolase [Candidatus Schekmanbacteria bacterium RBG_16_38_11]|uniref:Peptidyl-tRNA hydrolase n=2 Tax=Candidatus Schekmaniibacteriota TaxID=1817811 RepID=A0A1F7R9G8_9BACT|nr:MAG: aminoacyl-tRNA hydrolase [Candidatus Schekmanbacteria bacterium GWA2_38_11]OGL46092.1 MAG: aminoacyl-tRNA hydrolase [Candidatus Schekmanbacteria bacterium RBG_16_38_11]
MKLIVGLGNPGSGYKDTRHNIGFRAVDVIGNACGIKISKKKFFSQIGTGKIKLYDVILAKPLTYVNNSGEAVKKLLHDFSLTPKELIVVHDDIDLEKGILKIKERGGDGGHNGLRSMINLLQTDNFIRIRLGIGRPESKEDVVDYVLSSFDKKDQEWVQPLLIRAKTAVETLLIKGIINAMNEFNKRRMNEEF